MRSALSTGMTLLVILLLFLAFNLSWVNNLPEVRWDFSQQKTHVIARSAKLTRDTRTPVGLVLLQFEP